MLGSLVLLRKASDENLPLLRDAADPWRDIGPSDATRLIERDWPALEGLSGDQTRPLRLMRAFGVAAAGGPRDDCAVHRLLAPLRESRRGSLRYLTVAWPELAAFMELNHV